MIARMRLPGLRQSPLRLAASAVDGSSFADPARGSLGLAIVASGILLVDGQEL